MILMKKQNMNLKKQNSTRKKSKIKTVDKVLKMN